MNFKAYIPAKLKGVVDLIWEQEITEPGRFIVLPSGMVEIILPVHPIKSLKAVKIDSHDNPVNNCDWFLSGLHTKPLDMTFDRFHAFGVQMKPIAVKALFAIPLCEIRNYFVDGSIICNTLHSLEDQLHSKKCFIERAQWFESFLLKKINETADLHIAINLDRTIKKYNTQLQHGSPKTIEDIMGYSRTQTYRLFNEWFGISAYNYQKLLQFIRVVETLHDRNLRLIDAGLVNGYYDQAHFIRSFQQFADMTPGAYRKQMGAMPGQVIDVLEKDKNLHHQHMKIY